MTEQRRGLFGEGARLPEELSRLLFLEPVIQGRRVLEVGARSDSVARFLLELGASRVVCASEDRELVETLRANNELEKVDFRAIRPGVLPGDDGAFDLVIDFGLPEALAAGVTFRLTDMGRLLSEDGFAVTALRSTDARGLSTLLGERSSRSPASPVVADGHSAAGLAQHEGVVTYRGLVEALKLQFDLVQVYFQSLLLGYLFGSFDAEPTDDGVSPHTALMGNTPEPAGHYLFAFGRAVPVIEDVALVQVPFSDLLAVVSQRDARQRSPSSSSPSQREDTDEGAAVHERGRLETVPTGEAPPLAEAMVEAVGAALEVAAEAEASAAQSQRERDLALQLAGEIAAREAQHGDELAALRDAHAGDVAAREHAMVQIAARIDRLRGDIDVLVAELERRTAERDEIAVFLEGTDAAVAARDALIASLRQELDAALARMQELGESARAGSSLAASAAHLVSEHEALQQERNDLVERIATLEGERVSSGNRLRVLEEAHELSILRVGELEDALLTLESQRGQLAAELARGEAERAEDAERMNRERGAERQILEAAVQTHLATVIFLEESLEQSRLELVALRRETEVGSQEAQRAAILEARARQLETLVEERTDESRKEAARAKREAHDRGFLEERTRALEGQLEEASQLLVELPARKQDVVELSARVALLEQELAQAKQAAASAMSDALAARDEELAALTRHRAALEADAHKLADGVKTLVQEREQNRALAEAERARADESLARAHEAETRVGEMLIGYERAQHETMEARAHIGELDQKLADVSEQGEASQRKLRAAHAALEEARRELASAREGLQEIAGQRDTLNQVVSARERELFGIKDELLQATAEGNRLKEQLDAQHKALAEARQRVAAVEVDRATARRREEELGRAQQESAAALHDATERLARASAELVAIKAHVDDVEGGRARSERVLEQARQDNEAALQQARAEVRAVHDELARTRSELGNAAESLEAEGERLHGEVAQLAAENARLAAALATLSEEANRTLSAADDERARLTLEAEAVRAQLTELRAALASAAHATDAQHTLASALEARTTELVARVGVLEGALHEAQTRLASESASAELLRASLGEAQAALSNERARSAMLGAALEEAQAVLANERAKSEVLSAALEEAQTVLEHERASSELYRASLGEARSLLDVERARGDLFSEELEEAHTTLSRERARGDLFAADLDEAQQHIGALRDKTNAVFHELHQREVASGARAELKDTILLEAQARLGNEKARADLLAAQLVEAQQAMGAAVTYATLLASELDDARETFRRRKEGFEAGIDAERIRAAAAKNDGERVLARAAQLEDQLARAAIEGERLRNDERMVLEHVAAQQSARAAQAEDAVRRTENDLRKVLRDAEERMGSTGRAITGLEVELKDLKEKLAEQQSDDMLAQAERERLMATAESAERERDALLGDLTSHQGRANAEASRRLAVEEDLAKLRHVHNQLATEAQRLRQELDAGRRSPETEQELAALKERIDTLEKSAVTKEAKIVEQADRINRLTERLVREAGIA